MSTYHQTNTFCNLTMQVDDTSTKEEAIEVVNRTQESQDMVTMGNRPKLQQTARQRDGWNHNPGIIAQNPNSN